ncbi:MAG: tetratricopeptide repeat protein [Rhodospirillales bacterium]|nr:tetratricopeptide repeat protein [Rhodospirillales bacterium]
MNAAQRFLGMGYDLMQHGQNAEALVALEKARLLAPDHDQTLFLLGCCYRAMLRHDAALACFRNLADVQPNLAIGHYYVGLTEIDRRRFEQGQQAFAVAVRLSEQAGDDFYGILCAQGYALLKEEESERGFAVLQEARRRCPERGDALRILWRHLLQRGDIDGAVRQAEAALALNESPGLLAEARRYITMCAWLRQRLADLPAHLAGLQPAVQAKPGFVLGIAVWGEAYVRMCLYHLRTLAAPGNLPAMARHFAVKLLFVTTQQDRRRLEESGIFDLFSGIAEIDFLDLPNAIVVKEEYFAPSEHMYVVYAMAMHLCLEYARRIKAAVCPFVADTLVADGSFATLADLARQGFKTIFATGLVGTSETLLPEIDAAYGADGAPPQKLVIAPDELMRLGDRHLNAIFLHCIVSPSNADFSLPPGVLFWRTPEGLIGHGFNLHPVFIHPDILETYRTPVFATVDGHLPRFLAPGPKAWALAKVIDDSDLFGIITLAPAGKQFHKSGAAFNIEVEKNYVAGRWPVAAANLWLFRHPMLFRHVRPSPVSEYDPRIVDEIVEAFRHCRPREAEDLSDD